jgi:hypothetical protein
MHSLDPTQEEPEMEGHVGQAEEANPEPEPEQGRPRCTNQCSLSFILNPCFMFSLDLH